MKLVNVEKASVGQSIAAVLNAKEHKDGFLYKAGILCSRSDFMVTVNEYYHFLRAKY